MKSKLNIRAWLVWLLTAAVIIFLNQNPLYTVIVLLTAVILISQSPATPQPFSLLRLGTMIMLFTTLFNALFVHVGQTVLFTLPRHWLWIGGDVTLEAAVFGATSGLRLLTLFALFNVFNRHAPVAHLIRLMPRALRDLGVVVLIAVTYVPQTVRQWQRIREAQAIRGHQLRETRRTREADEESVEISTLASQVTGLQHEANIATPAAKRFRIAKCVLHDPFVNGACLVDVRPGAPRDLHRLGLHNTVCRDPSRGSQKMLSFGRTHTCRARHGKVGRIISCGDSAGQS
jgi:hypothetical protein